MYDVVFVADIYVPGGTNYQLAQNIRYLSSAGKRVGIVPVQLPHAQGKKGINRFIRETISEKRCEVIDQALGVVHAHRLIVDNPRLMAGDFKPKTRVEAGRTLIFVPFPPENGHGAATFRPDDVVQRVGEISESDITWAPVSNVVRSQLGRLFPGLPLTTLNAHPIVRADAYRFSAEIREKRKVLIGRHSRPEADKWPGSRSQFLKIYPSSTPFEVSLLGIDAASLSAIIGDIPRNYRVLPYDSVPVGEFLSEIDFFVYYHHSSWVEAFGIAIAEAMATGALCVLPRYLEANFGDAAVYAAPNDVRSEVLNLHRNSRKYRAQTRFARNFISREFSVDRFADFAREIGIGEARPGQAAGTRRRRYETVYLSDFASPKVFNYAFIDELTEGSSAGQRIAAGDIRGSDAHRVPAATHALATRNVTTLRSDESIICDHLIINDPWRLVTNSVDLGHFEAGRTTCLVSYPHGDLATIQRYLSRQAAHLAANLCWAPRDAHCRMWLESFDPNLVLTPTNWTSRVSPATAVRIDELRRQRPISIRITIGFIGIETVEDAKWVTSILPALDATPAPLLTYFGERPEGANFDPRVVCSGYLGIDLVKWVAKLDRLVIARDRLKADNLDYLVALCRHAGIPTLYRWRGNKERNSGSQSLEGLEKAELHRLLFADRGSPTLTRAAEPATSRVGQLGHSSLNGGSRPPTNGPAKARPNARPALLFVSQNGTGVGHVVRLLAIARKLSASYDCIFLTMSQAVPFISAFGFHVEYFPSSVYSGVSYTDWIYWLRKKVDLMLDAWGARAIVFDGNVPYAAVVEAAAIRPDVSSVWIRRGMWPDSEEDRRRLRAQTYFDVVIEPRDFAEDLDVGPTKSLRDTVHLVPPIQLLGHNEAMSREQACATLQMDPSATNLLIQLGSGNNRDTEGIIGKITAAVGSTHNLQIYNLRWPISDMPPTLIPRVVDLAVFPIARFYRAFDFSVSAAGYNTAHEVLSHRLPTIFVPNTAEGMDNQAGRADFSSARGLSLCGGLPALATNLRSMMDDDFRQAMRRRLRRLKLANGADDAATHIDRLAQGAG